MAGAWTAGRRGGDIASLSCETVREARKGWTGVLGDRPLAPSPRRCGVGRSLTALGFEGRAWPGPHVPRRGLEGEFQGLRRLFAIPEGTSRYNVAWGGAPAEQPDLAPRACSDDDLGRDSLDARRVGPLARAELTLDEEDSALGGMAKVASGAVAPDGDAMPLGAFSALAGLTVLPSLGRRKAKVGDLGRGFAVRTADPCVVADGLGPRGRSQPGDWTRAPDEGARRRWSRASLPPTSAGGSDSRRFGGWCGNRSRQCLLSVA